LPPTAQTLRTRLPMPTGKASQNISQTKFWCAFATSGHARWFERLLMELQFELWIGDAAEIRTKRVRKQKTDRQDAQLLLNLLMEDRFPRIWVPDAENRDLRQLLWHRHRLVQMRTRVMNQLHVVALNAGVRRRKARWRPAGRSELESLVLAPWASRQSFEADFDLGCRVAVLPNGTQTRAENRYSSGRCYGSCSGGVRKLRPTPQ